MRLIGADDRQRGVFSLSEAKNIAEEEGYDLILVNAKQNPIVVKLVNYGAYLYQKEKKQKSIKKQKEIKEIRISFTEAEYDLKRKVDLSKKFLENGHQVQIKLFLKGREKNFQELAEEKLNRFLTMISEKIKYSVSQPIKKSNNFLLIVINPSK